MQIDWNKRTIGQNMTAATISAGFTDFLTFEPTPFDFKLYLFKLYAPGLQYKVAVSICTRKVVWTHRPFEWGIFNSLAIFKLKP